jgi:hypothetical protein
MQHDTASYYGVHDELLLKGAVLSKLLFGFAFEGDVNALHVFLMHCFFIGIELDFGVLGPNGEGIHDYIKLGEAYRSMRDLRMEALDLFPVASWGGDVFETGRSSLLPGNVVGI